MWVNNTKLEKSRHAIIWLDSKFTNLYNCSQRQKVHENHIIVKKVVVLIKTNTWNIEAVIYHFHFLCIAPLVANTIKMDNFL